MNHYSQILLFLSALCLSSLGCAVSEPAKTNPERKTALEQLSVTEPDKTDTLPAKLLVKPVGIIGKTSGSGAYPAHAVADDGMRMNTLYVPANYPDEKLPLLIWGNGGCWDNGLAYSMFLREVASHGFFIVSSGYPRFERDVVKQGEIRSNNDQALVSSLPNTTVAKMLSAIDWAEGQNSDPQSPYFNKINTQTIGVMGTSCGGLQSITALTDPRISTGIGFNTGILLEPPPPHFAHNKNLHGDKSLLRKLQGPIAYINGGPQDIAYKNAIDDFQRIEHVPVFFGENGVGHGGTYLFDENGGEYAQVAAHWFAWQLKGDTDAAKWFVGVDCELCTRDGWTVKKKSIE